MLKKYCFLAFFVLSFFSCKNTTPDIDSNTTDFDNFYKKFHRDSVYQIEHIRFPLPGFPSFADSMTIVRNDFYWQKEDWSIQNEIDLESSEYKRELNVLGNLAIERVFLQEGVFIERRFLKTNDEWALIYYSDLNFGEQRE